MYTKKGVKEKFDVYEIVTDQIIEQLEKGVVPWKQTWTSSGLAFKNFRGTPYRGINILLLALARGKYNWKTNIFLTFNQCRKLV